MLTIFLSGAKLISLQALPPGKHFTQEYFVNNIWENIIDEIFMSEMRTGW
jgi:hypothetical protein